MRRPFNLGVLAGLPVLILALMRFASAQTVGPDITRALGAAVVKVDVFSPAQSIRIENLPKGTDFVSTLFASLDEQLEGQPFVRRHAVEVLYAFEDGGIDEDWDFIPFGHTYDISAEYDVCNPDGTETQYRTEPVRVTHVEFHK